MVLRRSEGPASRRWSVPALPFVSSAVLVSSLIARLSPPSLRRLKSVPGVFSACYTRDFKLAEDRTRRICPLEIGSMAMGRTAHSINGFAAIKFRDQNRSEEMNCLACRDGLFRGVTAADQRADVERGEMSGAARVTRCAWGYMRQALRFARGFSQPFQFSLLLGQFFLHGFELFSESA